MSLFDAGPIKGKRCFVYCGNERCNCESAPRYQHWPIATLEPQHQGEMIAPQVRITDRDPGDETSAQ